MTRRDFLKTTAWTSALFAATPFWAQELDEPMPSEYMSAVSAPTPIEWTVPAELANADPAALAVSRLTFGARPGDVARVQGMGIEAFIEEQLAPDAIADTQAVQMLKQFPSLVLNMADLGKYYAVPFMRDKSRKGEQKRMAQAMNGLTDLTSQAEENGMAMGEMGMSMSGDPSMDEPEAATRLQALSELIQATVLRQVFSERQLFEVMVDFWTNHFNIYAMKDDCRYLKTWDDGQVIRRYALGKFRDLLMASAKSPAMLVYLDNRSNIKGYPQENYAREVMELHTLGVDGGYTQKDVQEVARAFTGWSVITPNKNMSEADYSQIGAFRFRKRLHDQRVKVVLGELFPAGGGLEDGERVIEMLAAHPRTAEHVSRKLVQRFVDDTPPPALVARAAQTFQQSDGEIRAVLGTIFHSDEFKTSFGKKMKRPLEFVASALRILEASLTDVEMNRVTLRAGKKFKREPVAQSLRALGQVPFMWPSPNGYPDVAQAWVNSSNLLTRWNFALALTSNELMEFEVATQADAASSAEMLVDMWSARVLPYALPEPDRAKLVEFVRGDAPDRRLGNLQALLVASPHFQYR